MQQVYSVGACSVYLRLRLRYWSVWTAVFLQAGFILVVVQPPTVVVQPRSTYPIIYIIPLGTYGRDSVPRVDSRKEGAAR